MHSVNIKKNAYELSKKKRKIRYSSFTSASVFFLLHRFKEE